MTSPSPEVVPYALMLEVVGPLPRPWRMAAVRLMRDLASTLPADRPVGGVDASTVETTRLRAIGNGGVAAAAGGTDPPPATSHNPFGDDLEVSDEDLRAWQTCRTDWNEGEL